MPNTQTVIEKLREKTKDETELGEIVRSRRIDNENGNYHGYAIDQKQMIGRPAVFVWGGDNRVTSSEYWERKRRSYMPRKFLEKESKSFNWSLYGTTYEDGTKRIKADLNNFIKGFENVKNSNGDNEPGFCPRGIGLYINSAAHGSGKTLLGCVVASEIMKRFNHVSVKYITVPDYLDIMKGKIDQKIEKNREYRECTLLILDDMGSGKTDWDKDILSNLISYRMSQYKPIIYISSCEISKLTGDSKVIALIEDLSIDIGLPPVNVRNGLAEQRKKELLNGADQKETKEAAF